MSENSVFADDWRECLRVHYMEVCRREDHRTSETLTRVMFAVGFAEHDLAELRVRATIRAEDVPADFVPDMNVLEEIHEHVSTQEITEESPFVMVIPEIPEPEILEDSSTKAEMVEDTDSPDVDDPDAAQQLSLF